MSSISSAVINVKTIECLLCHASLVHNIDRYINHLVQEHNAIYGLDFLVSQTLNRDKTSSDSNNGEISEISAQTSTLETASQNAAPVTKCPKPITIPIIKLEHISENSAQPSSSDPISTPLSSEVKSSLSSEVHSQEETEPPKKKPKRDVQEQFILPWFAGCESECEICGELYFYNQELRSHIKTHHGDPNDYLERFSGFETKGVYFKCYICKKVIKRSFSGINQHLMQKHPEMDILTYQTKFNLYNYRLIKRDKNRTESSVTFKLFKDFAQGTCLYECSVCEFSCKSERDFWEHVLVAHGVEHKEAFINTHGNPCLIKSKLWCAVDMCSKLILHESDSMRKHLAEKHKSMDLNKYYETYYNLNIENAQRQPTKKSGNCNNDTTDTNRSTSTSTSHNRNKADCDDKWMNGNEYECRLCDTVKTTSKRDFLIHVNLDHDIDSYDDYVSKMGDPNVTSNLFKCPLCQDLINYDEYDINEHLEETHVDWTPKAYCNLMKSNASSVDKLPLLIPIKSMFDWNQCTYACLTCGKVAKSVTCMGSHIKHNHPGRVNLCPNEKYSGKRLEHKCKICCRNVLFEKSKVMKHLKFVHGRSINDYEREFEQELRADFAGLDAAKSLMTYV